MALLHELLTIEGIELSLKSRRKPDILRELVDILARSTELAKPDEIVRDLKKREKINTTGIGSGIAIPHCFTSQVADTRIVFGRRLEGAKFDAVDNQPVALFFLLIGPEGDEAGHLKVLSRLARYLHDRTFCNALLAASSAEEVMAAFISRESK